MKRLLLIGGAWALTAVGWTKFEPLPAENFSRARGGECVFFHAWSSICQPCMKGMPDLVEWLNAQRKVKPVVLDMSTPFVQDSVSKNYMRSLKPKFPSYLRPKLVDEKSYLGAWDSQWGGQLPYSELYMNGKRKKVWSGDIELSRIRREVAALCK